MRPIWHLRFIIVIALLVASCAHAQEINLFNGKDLTGWAGLKKFWSVEDGTITGKLNKSNGKGAENNYLVWQGGLVTDFELTFKYKLTALNPQGQATSAVQFRATYLHRDKFQLHGYQGRLSDVTDPALNPEGGFPNGCLREDKSPSGMLAHVGQKVVIHFAPPPPQGPPGNIEVVGTLAPDNVYQKLYRPNDWNDYRVTAVGNHIQIFVNGQQTVDVIDELNRAATGMIGFELHAFNPSHKTIQFKDIILRNLKPAVAQVAQTDTPKAATPPSQIEVLRDQAQNAIEWTLAPLDQPLPSDIRQNLNYLREDLLDEAKAAPKAGAKAYSLGSLLCDKILATIAERNETGALAGYEAAQANADVHVDSQALEARRNYMMSWPQYAREKRQRAEILRQQLSAADLKKERAVVAWATRTEDLRAYLDGLYSQFREALRQSPAVK